MSGEGTRMSIRRLAAYIGSAVLLAVVITATAALMGPSKPDRPSVSSPAVSAMRLAAQARDAASKNETESALSLANRALEVDPANAEARQLKEALTSAQVSSTAETSTNPAAGPGKYADPVPDMLVLLPASFRKWSRGESVARDGSAFVTFEPRAGDADYGRLVRASIYANDAGSPSAAEKMASGIHARVYPKNNGKVAVGVVDGAVFGTDGKQLAAVSFARGRYAFEVILTSPQSADLVKLKGLAVEIASAIPATR